LWGVQVSTFFFHERRVACIWQKKDKRLEIP